MGKDNSVALKPEEKARLKIDKQLESAGWAVLPRNEFSRRFNAQAIKENLMQGNLEADYLLYIAEKAIAVVEAKRAEDKLGDNVKAQAENYTKKLNNNDQYWFNPLPFAFISNGETILFKDMRDNESEWEECSNFLTPKELCEKAGLEGEFIRLPKVPPVGPNGLREFQYEAITEVELAFKNGDTRCLLDIATGAGKTFTACMLSYRLLLYAPSIQRILFLVDRNNLGKQAESAFKEFKLTENKENAFPGTYDVVRLRRKEDIEGKNVVISTIQRLYAVLCGKNFTEDDDDIDDENDDNNFFKEDENEPAIELTDILTLPNDIFQLIIVDECHRSIYGRWHKVLEYFNKARIIGLTATPTDQAYAFFDCGKQTNGVYKPTYQYSLEDSYRAGINVPPRVYRIKTAVTEEGGIIEEREKYVEVSNKTNEKALQLQEVSEKYEKREIDRSVVNPAQIKAIVKEFRDIIYDKLYPNRVPKWECIPKTLFFAKTDKHADLIVKIIKEVFAEKFPNNQLPENYVQKITHSSGDTNQLILDFRNEEDFRIAVTVTLVATGTDVKPIEIVVFMRDIHSSVLYTQMKGRGCRSISDEVLRNVTSNADVKENYYIIDAVGVTESEKKIPEIKGGINKKPSLEYVLEILSKGNVSDENLQFLGEKLAFINNRTEDKHQLEFEKVVKISMDELAKEIFKALQNGLPPYIDNNEPNLERKNLISSLLDNGEGRELLLKLEKGFYKLLIQAEDVVTYSDFSVEDCESYIKQFEEYIRQNADKVEALKIIYNDSDSAITYEMLKDLHEKIVALNPFFNDFSIIWKAYYTLSKSGNIKLKVKDLSLKEERDALTNLIQLVRFAYGKRETLETINGIINEKFDKYTGNNLGNVKRAFTDKEIEILKRLKDYVTQRGCISRIQISNSDKSLLSKLVNIYGNDKFDYELEFFSKFLLNIKKVV